MYMTMRYKKLLRLGNALGTRHEPFYILKKYLLEIIVNRRVQLRLRPIPDSPSRFRQESFAKK